MLHLNGPHWHEVYDKVRYWSNCVAVSQRLAAHLRPKWLDGHDRSLLMC